MSGTHTNTRSQDDKAERGATEKLSKRNGQKDPRKKKDDYMRRHISRSPFPPPERNSNVNQSWMKKMHLMAKRCYFSFELYPPSFIHLPCITKAVCCCVFLFGVVIFNLFGLSSTGCPVFPICRILSLALVFSYLPLWSELQSHRTETTFSLLTFFDFGFSTLPRSIKEGNKTWYNLKGNVTIWPSFFFYILP